MMRVVGSITRKGESRVRDGQARWIFGGLSAGEMAVK
jgi:hypothetical protein